MSDDKGSRAAGFNCFWPVGIGKIHAGAAIVADAGNHGFPVVYHSDAQDD